MLRNRSEAEDVVQASYARALAAIGNFEGRSALSTWLTRITINEALARLRVQERRRKYLEANNVSALDHYRDRMARGSDSPSPEAEAAREQLRQLLEQAVSGLSDAFRTTFVLHEVDGLPVEDIADVLGIPTGTVKTRLFRARRMLREALAPDVRSALSGTFPFAGADCERLTERVLAAHLGSPVGEQPGTRSAVQPAGFIIC